MGHVYRDKGEKQEEEKHNPSPTSFELKGWYHRAYISLTTYDSRKNLPHS